MHAMSLRKFNTLSDRDFANGAVIGEIYTALKQREDLISALGYTLSRCAALPMADKDVLDNAIATYREAKAANQ